MRVVYPFGDRVTHTPTPILRAFPWQQWSMEQCARSQGWSVGPEMGALGDVCLSQDHSFFFFGHGSSLESMCLTVMSAGRLFSKGLIHKSLWRERESGCLFLTWLGLVNYIVKALLLQQVNAGALRCGCLMVSCCPLLASAALTRKRKYWHMT